MNKCTSTECRRRSSRSARYVVWCIAVWVCVVVVACVIVKPAVAQKPFFPTKTDFPTATQIPFFPTKTDFPTATQIPSFPTKTNFPTATKTPTRIEALIPGELPFEPPNGNDGDEKEENPAENPSIGAAVAGAVVAVVVLVLVVGSVIKRGRDQKHFSSEPILVDGHHHNDNDDDDENEKDSSAKRSKPNEEGATDINCFELESSTNFSGSPPPSSTNDDSLYGLSDDQPSALDVRLDVSSLGDLRISKQDSSNSLALLGPHHAVEELTGPVRLALTTEFYKLYLRNERSHLQCFPVCREFNEGPSVDEKASFRLHQVLKRGTCGDAIHARVTALKTHVASDLVLLGRVSYSKLATDLLVGDSCTWSRIEILEKNNHYVRGFVTIDDIASAECVDDRCTFMVSFKPQGQWTFKGRLSKKHPLYFEVFVLGPDSFRQRAVHFDSLENESDTWQLDTGGNVAGSGGGGDGEGEIAKFANDLVGDLFGDGLDDLFVGGGLEEENILVLDGYLGPPSKNNAGDRSSVESRSMHWSNSGRQLPQEYERGRVVFGKGLTFGNQLTRPSGAAGASREKDGLVVLGSTRSCDFKCATTKSRRVAAETKR